MVKTGFYLNKDLTVFVRQISCFVFVRKVEFCVVSANANPGKIYQLFFGHLVLLVEIIIPQEESQELNKNTRSRRLNQLAGGILPHKGSGVQVKCTRGGQFRQGGKQR